MNSYSIQVGGHEHDPPLVRKSSLNVNYSPCKYNYARAPSVGAEEAVVQSALNVNYSPLKYNYARAPSVGTEEAVVQLHRRRLRRLEVERHQLLSLIHI